MRAECIDLVLNSYPIFEEKARLEPLRLTSQNMPTTFSKPLFFAILDLSTFDNQHHRSTSDPWYMVRAVQPRPEHKDTGLHKDQLTTVACYMASRPSYVILDQ